MARNTISDSYILTASFLPSHMPSLLSTRFHPRGRLRTYNYNASGLVVKTLGFYIEQVCLQMNEIAPH